MGDNMEIIAAEREQDSILYMRKSRNFSVMSDSRHAHFVMVI